MTIFSSIFYLVLFCFTLAFTADVALSLYSLCFKGVSRRLALLGD
jgi:hypothetical protein